MSYKQLNGEKNYGSITSSSTHSQLLELSGEVESEGDEELEFKKRRMSKQLNGEKNYGSITSSSTHSQLLELSGEVESEGDEELEFKKRKMSKQLNGEKNYGSITSSSTHSQLLELSGEVESEGDEELEFKKQRMSLVTVMRYFGATMCLIIMVLSWVAMAEKIQDLEVDYPHKLRDEELKANLLDENATYNKGYKKPYFLIYWVHSFYSLLYVVWKIWRIFPGGYKCNSAGDGIVTPRKMFFVSGYMDIVLLISGYFWYLSLPRTSVAINTSIYQSSSAVVFVLAVILLGESVTLVKVISLGMSVSGVCMAGFFSTHNNDAHSGHSHSGSNFTDIIASNVNAASQSSENNNTVLGILYLIVSMVTYGLFEVSAKKWLAPAGDTAPTTNSLRGLGLMGVHTLLWMWPPIIILHYAGVELFIWPSRHNLDLMVLSAVLDILFNASLLVCISLVSPLFASVGTILAIPAAMVWDYFSKHSKESDLAYGGTILIIAGFLGFVVSEGVAEVKKHKTKNTIVSSQESTFFKKPSFGWI